MAKFKKGNEVLDNCGCHYIIKKVGRKYYTCYHVQDTKFIWQVEIEMLDSRATLCKERRILRGKDV